MKKTILVIGLLATFAAAYVGRQLWAQPQGHTAAPAHTRIAFVNVTTVFQNYRKAQVYKEEMEKLLEEPRTQVKKFREEIEKWKDYLKRRDINQTDREKGEAQIVYRKRKIEDINRQVGKLVGEKQKEQVVQLFKEVNDAVRTHAMTHGFHAVLAYADPDPKKADPFSFKSILRKVQGMEMGASTVAMHIAPGLDISEAVVVTLNRNFPGGSTVNGKKVSYPGR